MANPRIIAFLTCEKALIEEKTRKVSLINLFNLINAKVFPTSFGPFHIFIKLAGIEPETVIEMVLTMTSPSGKEILRFEGKADSLSGQLDIPMDVPTLNFEEPGVYIARVTLNGSNLGETTLEVRKKDVSES